MKLFFCICIALAIAVGACAPAPAPTPTTVPVPTPTPAPPGRTLEYWFTFSQTTTETKFHINWNTHPKAQRCELGAVLRFEGGSEKESSPLWGGGQGEIVLSMRVPPEAGEGGGTFDLSIQCFYPDGVVGQTIQFDLIQASPIIPTPAPSTKT